MRRPFLSIFALAAALCGPVLAQGNEFYLRIKMEVVDGSLEAESEGSMEQVANALLKNGYREIAVDIRAGIDKVVNEKLTLDMLSAGDVTGSMGLDIPQGVRYHILGISRVHFVRQNGPHFIYKSNIQVVIKDVEEAWQRRFTREGVGTAPSRRQAIVMADREAGRALAAEFEGLITPAAKGNWFKIRLHYSDRREGLRTYQKVRGLPFVAETKRVSTDETTMLIEARCELSMTDFQDEFELWCMDNLPGAKIEFARDTFNVTMSGGAAADVTKHCEEGDVEKRPDPPTWVEAAGLGVIENGNVDAARKEALFAAFRSAVEQGVHVYIDSRTVVENFETIEDSIYTEASGFVEEHQIVAEGPEDAGIYGVRIRAKVVYGKIKETLASLRVLQEQIGRVKTAVVYEWLPYDSNPRAPAGPVSENRVMRMTDGPANDVVAEATRFLRKKKFTVYDQGRMRAFYQRMVDREEVHESEARIVDMLANEDMPCDLILFVTCWSEGVEDAGGRRIVYGKVQVKAYVASLMKVLDVKIRRGQKVIAGGSSNPERQLSILAQQTCCELVRELWPELRSSLEEEKTFEVFLRNMNQGETKDVISAIKGVRGVHSVVRNRSTDRLTALTVYTAAVVTPDQFLEAAGGAVREAVPRSKSAIDRQMVTFYCETYFED